jgi:hypothetical protein
MPRVGAPPLPSKVPPKVGTICAYLSWFVSVAGLNRLPEWPRGEPCVHDTIGGHVGTLLIL